MAIVAIGFNPAIDRIIECPDFHIGGHQQASQRALLAAGKAANVNRALAQLGTDSIASGFVGSTELEFFHEQLMSTGPGRVLCRFVEVTGKTRENITILDPKRRIETHLRDKGFAVTRDETALLEQKVMHELKPGDVAIFSGSLCEGLSADYFGTLLDKCAATGARVAVDSSGDPLRAAAEHGIWLLKPNLEELRQLLGVEVPNTAASIRDAASPLLKNAKNVLVTRGPLGAVLLTTEGGAVAYSGRVGRVGGDGGAPRRTVGCGDHLLAGFVSEMVAGRSAQQSLATALALATARAMSEKLDEIDQALLKESLQQIQIEKI
ncbi:MAG TPA: hexose kinase [Phycisphaerae bacterium]|nr:hexose kinase [Phycisphaerae bacterium]